MTLMFDDDKALSVALFSLRRNDPLSRIGHAVRLKSYCPVDIIWSSA